jgi:hypothetical protein
MEESEMKRTAPLLTLLAGLGVGTVLFLVNNVVAANDPVPVAAPVKADANAAASPSPTAAAKPTAPAVERIAPKEKVNVTWAGDVDGGKATIAISVKDGVAIAYVCDGRRVEAWLQGVAADGKLDLEGKGATLAGTFGDGRAKGTVTVGRATWTFDVPAVSKPSGLYRATANVRNAEVVSGWIVVRGRQVGAVSDGEVTEPAPPLPLPSLTAVWNGVPLVATPVN